MPLFIPLFVFLFFIFSLPIILIFTGYPLGKSIIIGIYLSGLIASFLLGIMAYIYYIYSLICDILDKCKMTPNHILEFVDFNFLTNKIEVTVKTLKDGKVVDEENRIQTLKELIEDWIRIAYSRGKVGGKEDVLMAQHERLLEAAVSKNTTENTLTIKSE